MFGCIVNRSMRPLVVGSAWWRADRLKESVPLPGGTSSVLFKGLRQTFRNRPFMILLIAYTIGSIGNNLPATLILYHVEYVLKPPHADFFLLLYFSTGIVFLPGRVAVARRIGKKRAWIASITINTGAFVGVFFLGLGDAAAYGALVFLSGVGFGATHALPSSMQADVIDYEEL